MKRMSGVNFVRALGGFGFHTHDLLKNNDGWLSEGITVDGSITINRQGITLLGSFGGGSGWWTK